MADEIEIELPGPGGGWTEIDTGRASRPVRPRQGRSGQRSWRRAAAVAAPVLLVAFALTRGGSSRDPASTTVAPSSTVADTVAPTSTVLGAPSSTQALSAAPPSSDPSPTRAPGRPDRFALDPTDGRLTVPVAGLAPGEPTGLEVVALGTGGRTYDVDVDANTITVFDTPLVQSSAPTWIAAGTDWVVVRPYDDVPGFVLRGDGTRAPLPGLLGDGTSTMLRGPGASVWVFTSTRRLAGTPGLVLVGLDGRPTGPVVTTTGLDVLGTDGTGGLLVRATGGTYLYAGADASGGTRVSTGDVLATSADRLLTVECDDGLRCARWLIDRRTGERTRVADDRPRAYSTTVGSLSPDGTHAVVLRDDDLRRWELVSTTPGASSITPILTLDPEQPATLAWSDDGRYVVYLGSSRLWLLDTATGEDRPLVPSEAGLPDVYTFADRRAR